MTSALPL